MQRRNRHPRHAHIYGTPAPGLPCLYCPRHFRSKTGRTRHINAKHLDAVDEDCDASPPLLLSGRSSGSQRSHRPRDDKSSPVPPDRIPPDRMPSPIPPDRAPSPIPHNFDMDDDPHADRGYTPIRSESESSSSAEDRSRQASDPPRIRRTYHNIMDGTWCAAP
jgi:hypothetical protein